jgi:hypothetical protein
MEPQPEFLLGQRVSVLVNERNHTARVGTVARVVWHHKDACYNYYLEVDGKNVSKRYLSCDLTSSVGA